MNLQTNISIIVSEDKLQAFIITSNNLPLERTELEQLLQEQNIVFGINENTLEQLLTGTLGPEKHLIAQGIPPQNGQKSQAEFYFNTIPYIERESIKREDDSVNYHNKGIIDYVSKGDIVAKVTAATEGTKGSNVHGEELPAEKGEVIPLPFNKTIAFADDKQNLIALNSGHPIFKNNQLEIQTAFEILNVDYSTGNIDYKGNLLVLENIRSGFDVKTDGNLEVRGAIHHTNSYVKGNIVCRGGKIPGEEDSIIAEGDIAIEYIEGGTVTSGDTITVKEHIINSQITAKTAIICKRKDALIVGGTIKAGELIQTFDLGSAHETETNVILDNVSEKIAKLKEAEGQLRENQKLLAKGLSDFLHLGKLLKNKPFLMKTNKEQIVKILSTYAYIKNARNALHETSQILRTEKERIQTSIQFGKSPELYVYGTIHPKVHVIINHARISLRSALSNIKFSVFNSEIQIHSLKHTEDEKALEVDATIEMKRHNQEIGRAHV